MKKILDYFRVREWYDSKIPMAMAVFLYCVLHEGGIQNYGAFLLDYGAFFLYFAAYYAFNYLINDYFDQEADRKAGKEKVIQSVPDTVIFLSFAALFLIGTLPLWRRGAYALPIIITSLLTYLLGISYSVKGLRMKERGLWGLVVSAFAQRNSPVLLLFVMKGMAPLTFWTWMALSFINGLRYILIHQFLDCENDRKSGVHTFVSDKGAKIAAAVKSCLLAEVLCLVILFWDALSAPAVWCFAALYIGICILNADFLTHVTKQSWLYSFGNVPLEDFYNLFLPLALTAILCLDVNRWEVLVITAVYLFPTMHRKLGMPLMDVRIRLAKSAQAVESVRKRGNS